MVEHKVENEVKIHIIENEILLYTNTNYQLGLRSRTARIVENKDLETNCEKEVEKNLKILEFLDSELKKVRAEQHE
jgi:hypothetical protein